MTKTFKTNEPIEPSSSVQHVIVDSGGGADPVGLKNTSAVAVNPATSDKQDSAKAVLDNIKTKTDNLNITTSALRDAIVGSGPKTLTDLATAIAALLRVEGAVAADAPVSTTKPLIAGARGSAATPTAMSANGDSTPLWSDLYGRLKIIVDTLPAISGTVAVSSIPAITGTVDQGNPPWQVHGPTQDNGTDDYNPVRIGARARSTLYGTGSITDGRVAESVADLDRTLLVRTQVPLYDLQPCEPIDATSSPAACGITNGDGYTYLTAISVFNTDRGSGIVYFGDGGSNTAYWMMPCPISAFVPSDDRPHGGGSVMSFDPPIKMPMRGERTSVWTDGITAKVVVQGFASTVG